jgi:hypothetical protein
LLSVGAIALLMAEAASAVSAGFYKVYPNWARLSSARADIAW